MVANLPTCFLLVVYLGALVARGQKGDGCGRTLLGSQSGTLASQNFPGTYPNNTWCEWKLQVPPGRTLRLTFGDFDLEWSSECIAGSLTITPGDGGPALGPLCGHLDATRRKLNLNSSDAVVRFVSGKHRSGRGFLLSYATDLQSDLISCMERGTHFSSPQFSAFCPAGCRDTNGDIWGGPQQGYRDTSVLCKAAIHAGVVADAQGGDITVSRERSITRYDSSFANGLQSKTGSLSEKKLVFHKDCSQQLNASSFNASSVWDQVDEMGHRTWRSPGSTGLARGELPWVAKPEDTEPWLQVQLQSKCSVTGIITKGSTSGSSSFYVKSYTLQYSKDGRNWKVYKVSRIRERKVFEANSDGSHDVLNSLIPPVVAQYLLLRPLEWHNRPSVYMQIMGCPSGKPRTDLPPLVTTQETILRGHPEIKEDNKFTVTAQTAVVVVGVALLVALCLCALLLGLRWRRRKSAADVKSLTKGCNSLQQKSLPPGESELILYPRERDVHDALPPPPFNDYAEPDLLVTGQNLGSTFRPASDEGYTIPLIVNHYDVPGKAVEYAEPLLPEPEYAMPFGEQALDMPGVRNNARIIHAQYDCPAPRSQTNGYCSPAPTHICTMSYDEPQPANALLQHTYNHPS